MKRYTETRAFIVRQARLNADLQRLTATRVQLAGIKRRLRTDEQHRQFTNLVSRIKTAMGKLERLDRLNLPTWDLLHLLMEADDTTWTYAEADSWHKELATHEGRGEKALRMRYGLPIVSTQGDCDIPELNEEIKNLQGRGTNGKFLVQDIQTGKAGRKTYSMWMMCAAELGRFLDMPEELRIALGTGELPAGTLYHRLPTGIGGELCRLLDASQVLGRYDAVNGTTRFGFIRIPRQDCDLAWSLECVTKMGPKYVLKKSYLIDRLLKTMASPPQPLPVLQIQQQTDVAAE